MDKTNEILDALEELKELLIGGKNHVAAIAQVAKDYDLNLVLLGNRAFKAFGDLDSYGDRQRAIRQTLKTQLAEHEARIAIAHAKMIEDNRKFMQDLADFTIAHPEHAGFIRQALRKI